MTGVFSEREALLHGEYGSIDLTVESCRAAAKTYDEAIPPTTKQTWESMLKRIPY
jgi:hypothetical protein